MSKYKGTFSLLLLSITIQCLCSMFPSLIDVLVFKPQSWTFPITILTAMVSHGSWAHLIGNYMFGLPAMMYMESKLGRVRFLELFVLCGLFGSMLDLIMIHPEGCIGSSGAIAGIFAAACMVFGTNRLEHLLAMTAMLCFLVPQIEAAPFEAFVGIGFWCHIGGALAGILLTHRLYRPKCLETPCKHRKVR